MKSSYSILLVVGVVILVAGLVGLGITLNQEPTKVENPQFTVPPTLPPLQPHLDLSPSGRGYSDGYYGHSYAPPYCDRYYYEKALKGRISWEDYCGPIEWERDQYTEGYIEGSIDRKLEEQQ